MSAQKKKPQAPAAEVDWAERLKAAMNESPVDPQATSSAPEEDDLAALLRAQLARRDETAEVSYAELDTREFEEEPEELSRPEESVESEVTVEFELTVASEEENVREPILVPVTDGSPVSDDLPWEDDDLPWEENEPTEDGNEPTEDGNDALSVEPVVFLTAEDDDRPIASPLSADVAFVEYDDEDISDGYDGYDGYDIYDPADDEIIPDELPEPITVTVYRAEPSSVTDEREATEEPDELEELDEPDELDEIDEPDESDELDENDESDGTADGVTAPPADTAMTPLSVEFRYLSPDGDVGDIRLQAADIENTRIMREEGVFEDGDTESEESRPAEAVDGEGEEAVSAAPRSVEERTPQSAPAVHPMQLGLDDVVTAADPRPAAEPVPSRRKAVPSDYTARMHREAREVAAKDTDLYLHLGYEDKLTRSEEQAAVEEARRRAYEREDAAQSRESLPKGGRREFTDRRQTPAIERAYTRATRSNAVRLCIAAVGALFGILYGYVGVLSAPVSALTFTDAPLYPLLGLLWTVAVCLPFLTRLARGVGSLVAFEPTRYAVSALALAAALVNDAITVFTHGYRLFGGVALLMLAVAALSEFLAGEGEKTAFSVVSAGKTSFVLTDEATPASVCRGESAPDESTLTAVRTGRLADYFARTGKYNPYAGRLNYLLPVALLCAILCGGIAALTGTATVDGLAAVFTAAYLTCLPSAYLLALSLPLHASNRLLRKKGAAVVGTAAPADYAGKGSTRLLFRDGDAVGGLRRKEITLRDDPDTAAYRQKAAKLFRLMECPLWNESPLGDDDPTGLCLEVAESGEGFVRLYLVDLTRNETVEVMMGSHADLSRRGVRLPKLSMEKTYKKSESSQVVYLAFDGRFRLAYSVEYRAGKTFTRAVEKLASLGDTASLSTYDPLVDASLLNVEGLKDQSSVGILRPSYVESRRAARSGGVIATGRSLDLLYPYAACRRMKGVYAAFHAVSWCCMLLGAALTALTVCLGYGHLLSAATVTVWQLLLSAAAVAVTLLRVNRKSLFLNGDKKKQPAPPAPNGDKQS